MPGKALTVCINAQNSGAQLQVAVFRAAFFQVRIPPKLLFWSADVKLLTTQYCLLSERWQAVFFPSAHRAYSWSEKVGKFATSYGHDCGALEEGWCTVVWCVTTCSCWLTDKACCIRIKLNGFIINSSLLFCFYAGDPFWSRIYSEENIVICCLKTASRDDPTGQWKTKSSSHVFLSGWL